VKLTWKTVDLRTGGLRRGVVIKRTAAVKMRRGEELYCKIKIMELVDLYYSTETHDEK